MARALVTGATGFLGRHTVRRLAELGWEVYGLGRNREAGELVEQDGAVFLCADLRDREAAVRACEGMDLVFHCAALSSPWGKYSDFYACNADATRNIAEGCKRHGVQRLIHISTPSLYTSRESRIGIREEDPLPPKPANTYAATKLLAEQAVQQAAREGLTVFILRPRAIFGSMDNALFPRILAANERKGVPFLDGGRAMIDLTCVENVIDAMLLCCTAPLSAAGQAYNISNGEPVMFRELLVRLFARLDIPLHSRQIPYRTAYAVAGILEGVHKLLPFLGEPVLTRYSASALGVSQTLDISLARDRLGYHPRVTIDEGLQSFAEWWREQT
ncbi:NAD(P)-dependent oxidoreductase [Paenibacillus sp. S150]|uniref:NAD-dependent epimerase/dehydratase family protein n=1 Tax=Paenibacillus sp. S150 TaxID=2749826 RepID=UPI001C55FC1C|nr:SDR family NAD(P)-dependent oxidoreductase [Paenibacillus sp. S150]MBW4083127.1 SDR family NAD(P)-dependent oxidoreductase [Paenibacillus sp. S150]